MKKVSLFAFVLTITFTSCNLMDNSLISDIISATKTEVSSEELPNSAQELLNTNYFGTYIDEVLHAESLGFEVLLSDESKVYFDEEGDCLNGSEKGGKKGRKGHGRDRGATGWAGAAVAHRRQCPATRGIAHSRKGRRAARPGQLAAGRALGRGD